MKKALIMLVAVVLVISLALFVGVACKTGTTATTTAATTAAAAEKNAADFEIVYIVKAGYFKDVLRQESKRPRRNAFCAMLHIDKAFLID